MLIDKKIYTKISKETLTNYEGELVKNEEYFYVDDEGIIAMLEDLFYEIEHWKEKYKDLEQDLADNYKPIPYEDQI